MRPPDVSLQIFSALENAARLFFSELRKHAGTVHGLINGLLEIRDAAVEIKARSGCV
jgi:hypothetical protein